MKAVSTYADTLLVSVEYTQCNHRSNFECHWLKLVSFIPCFSFDNSALERDNENYIYPLLIYVYIYKWCYRANKFSAQYGYEILVIINNYLNAGYPFTAWSWLYWLRWYSLEAIVLRWGQHWPMAIVLL